MVKGKNSKRFFWALVLVSVFVLVFSPGCQQVEKTAKTVQKETKKTMEKTRKTMEETQKEVEKTAEETRETEKEAQRTMEETQETQEKIQEQVEAPEIQNVDVETGTTTATITWYITTPGVTKLKIDRAGGYKLSYMEEGEGEHKTTVRALKPDTTYKFKIEARKAGAGDHYESKFATEKITEGGGLRDRLGR